MTNQTLANALTILRLFDASHPDWGVSELCNRTGLSKSHVSKVLKGFRETGFLEQDAVSRRYRVGIQSAALGAGYYFGSRVIKIAENIAANLAHRMDATVMLNVIEDGRVFFISAKTSDRRPLFSLPIGSYIPLHATAAGKIAAAFAPSRDIASAADNYKLQIFTPSTIRHLPTLQQQLAEVRRRGFAYSAGESTFGVGGVAAPVINKLGKISAAITLLFPLERANRTSRLLDLRIWV